MLFLKSYSSQETNKKFLRSDSLVIEQLAWWEEFIPFSITHARYHKKDQCQREHQPHSGRGDVEAAGRRLRSDVPFLLMALDRVETIENMKRFIG